MSSNKIIITPNEWDTSAIKYMKPFVTKSGSKSINIISKQTNRTLYISTPMMMTWGVSDFTDANGDSDGKFSISLNFPNDEYRNEQTDLFLQKMKDFENQVLDDAVKNSESWWGEQMSREICKHAFFPILKYSKNKDTHKVDYTKPPSFRAKVPVYDGVWKVEVYDTKGTLIFPNNNPDETPDKIITKLSSVACGIQCGGIWIAGRSVGVTWKLIQCVVKPKEVVSISGRCFIELPFEEKTETEKAPESAAINTYVEPVVIRAPVQTTIPVIQQKSATEAEDTDDETEQEEENVTFEPKEVVEESPIQPVATTETIAEEEVMPTPSAVVKKIIKKTVIPPAPPAAVVEPVATTEPVTETPNKKIVKKIVKK
jgi:hypothetical protein